jgi:dolichyl-phosphate beta-glucosyltransferase
VQLIIPALNEARRLPATLTALREWCRTGTDIPVPIEVIVVDNGSTDRTAAVAATFDSPVLPVRVIECAVPGKGAAVRAGVLHSTADVVGFMDADGATDLSAVADALAALSTGADLAIGSRAVPGSQTFVRHSRVRVIGAWLYRSLAGRVVPGIADTQCGFKVMRGDAARALLDTPTVPGFSFDVELLARAQRDRLVIAELPVTWVDVPGSTFEPARHGARAFGDLAVIGWRTRRSARPADVRSASSAPAGVVLPPLAPAAGEG